MSKLSQVFNLPTKTPLVDSSHPSLITDDMVGIEIELENVLNFRRLLEKRDRRWDVVEDGSLRNHGAELVFADPLYGADVVEALESLPPLFKRIGINPSFSERTSVHVHLDVRDLEYEQLLTLIVVYLLCEPYFFAVGGEERRDSVYSTPLATSSHYLDIISTALRVDVSPESNAFRRSVTEDLKYSALNIAPVLTQGSIEFRHHRGEYDPDTLINWVNMVLAMKRYTMQLGEQRMTPEFIDNIVNGQYEEFIEQVFKDVNVPKGVYGWDTAARVAKRVSSRAASVPKTSPMLPTVGPAARNLFAVAQRRVGTRKIRSYKEMVVNLNGGETNVTSPMYEVQQNNPSLARRIRGQESNWINFNTDTTSTATGGS